MYDTIHFFLPAEALTNHHQLKNISSHLTTAYESENMKTGKAWINGNLRNVKVNIYLNGISLQGSICKYYLNDNFQTLALSDVNKCIESLSDNLHLPLAKAKVTRIDIAHNLIMKYPVSVYYSYLGDATDYERFEQPNGIYYLTKKNTTSPRKLSFYSKVAEQKNKRLPIPEMYNKRNVLRYEMSFLKKLPAQFNMPYITPSTLADEKFYMNIIDKWQHEYLNIKKEYMVNFDLSIMDSIKDYEKQIYLSGLKAAFGSERMAMQSVNIAKQLGIFKNNMQVKRIKAKINQMTSVQYINSEPEAISELNKKVKDAVKYYI